jgi:hypothetical protein
MRLVAGCCLCCSYYKYWCRARHSFHLCCNFSYDTYIILPRDVLLHGYSFFLSWVSDSCIWANSFLCSHGGHCRQVEKRCSETPGPVILAISAHTGRSPVGACRHNLVTIPVEARLVSCSRNPCHTGRSPVGLLSVVRHHTGRSPVGILS